MLFMSRTETIRNLAVGRAAGQDAGGAVRERSLPSPKVFCGVADAAEADAAIVVCGCGLLGCGCGAEVLFGRLASGASCKEQNSTTSPAKNMPKRGPTDHARSEVSLHARILAPGMGGASLGHFLAVMPAPGMVLDVSPGHFSQRGWWSISKLLIASFKFQAVALRRLRLYPNSANLGTDRLLTGRRGGRKGFQAES